MYHNSNLNKVCGLCGIAKSKLRPFIWKRHRIEFDRVRNIDEGVEVPNNFCHNCKVNLLKPLNEACRPEAVAHAKDAISRVQVKFPSHTDECFICLQFEDGKMRYGK